MKPVSTCPSDAVTLTPQNSAGADGEAAPQDIEPLEVRTTALWFTALYLYCTLHLLHFTSTALYLHSLLVHCTLPSLHSGLLHSTSTALWFTPPDSGSLYFTLVHSCALPRLHSLTLCALACICLTVCICSQSLCRQSCSER